MTEDISRTTIVALALLTLTVSIIGSFIVVSELAVVDQQVPGPAVGEAKLTIGVPEEPQVGFSSGTLGIQIVTPED